MESDIVFSTDCETIYLRRDSETNAKAQNASRPSVAGVLSSIRAYVTDWWTTMIELLVGSPP